MLLAVGSDVGTFEENPLWFPQHTFTDESQVGAVVKRVMNDAREAAGLHAIDDFEIAVGSKAV